MKQRVCEFLREYSVREIVTESRHRVREKLQVQVPKPTHTVCMTNQQQQVT
jgi:hypothetical protein